MSPLIQSQRSLLAPAWAGYPNELWRRAKARPSLDQRFADDKSLRDAVSGQQLITFTRASSGTYVDSQGVIRTAVTNLAFPSNMPTSTTQTTTGNMQANGATQITSGVVAPDGSTNGFTVSGASVTTNTSGSNNVRILNVMAAAGTHTVSMWIKTNISSTTVTVRDATSATALNFTTTSNWTRISATFNNTSAGNIIILSASGTAFDCFGVQVEQSATAGEYIPTTSTINSAPRFDHNPTTGESLGLLVEESRTNLLLQSNGFDTTWTNSLTTETANAGTAPDGTNTAWELKDTVDATASQHLLSQTPASFVSGTTYSYSVWAKSGTLTHIALTFPSSAFTSTLTTRYSLQTGTAVSVAVGTTATVTAFPNGWYRVTTTAAATASASGVLNIRLALAGTTSYQGDGTGTILIWGAQLEAGSFPTSYIPTTTATATRSADVASITGSNFSSRVNTSSGSFLSEAIPLSISSSRIIQMGDGTGNNRQDLAFSSGSALAFVNTGGATQVNAVTTNTASANVLSKVGYAYSLDDFAWTLNAGSIRTDTAGSLPVVNQLGIGQRLDSTGFLNGTLRRLCFWPQRLPNETLQGITQ